MDKTLEMRPSTPGVQVIDLGWQGSPNPNPLIKDEDESLVDEYLSPARLKALTGADDLQELTTLQMCVDTRDHTLGNFGEGCFLGTCMPNLRQLKLNNSIILSVRDLGTSLSNLQVLWLARCGLTDLDGIASFFSLKELYLAYNDLTDLSQISMLEHLEILDLEGNNIDNISELQYLALCSNLTTLTIEGNPICVRPTPEDAEPTDYNYRAVIKKMIPQLQFLDDIPADHMRPTSPHIPTPDWWMVKDSIKESTGSQMDTSLDASFQDQRRPLLQERPSTAQTGCARRPHSAPRPSTAGRSVSSLYSGRILLPETPGDNPVDNEASDLTHGIGRVICGNPIKALRTRREKLRSAPVSNLQPHRHEPEHTFDPVKSSPKDRDEVFAELKAWRAEHNEALKRIQDQQAPQVLKITHSDEESEDYGTSSSEEEDLEDSWNASCLIRVTPETLSPSPRSPTRLIQTSTESTVSVSCLDRSTVRNSSPPFIPSHQPIIRATTKTPERPSPPRTIRPVTAKGILQRLPNRPTVLTASKTSDT
ncbi:leucine-rich repeat-containing protein 56 [Gastrophryne carolinensis]